MFQFELHMSDTTSAWNSQHVAKTYNKLTRLTL